MRLSPNTDTTAATVKALQPDGTLWEVMRHDDSAGTVFRRWGIRTYHQFKDVSQKPGEAKADTFMVKWNGKWYYATVDRGTAWGRIAYAATDRPGIVEDSGITAAAEFMLARVEARIDRAEQVAAALRSIRDSLLGEIRVRRGMVER